MRKLWFKLVHGSDTDKAQDVEESRVVPPEEMGGDPAPGYEWRVIKWYGDDCLTLRRWTGAGWSRVSMIRLSTSQDLSVWIPEQKNQIWKKEKLRLKNERYLESLKNA